MDIKFSLQQFIFIISGGIFWFIIFCYFLIKLDIISLYNVISYDFDLFTNSLLLIFAYSIGHLMQFTGSIFDKFIESFYKSPINWVLSSDREIFYKNIKMKGNSIYLTEEHSKIVEDRLKELNIYDINKKSQFFIAKSYLDINYKDNNNKKYEELLAYSKSLFFPYLFIVIIILIELIIGNVNNIFIISYIIFILFVTYSYIIQHIRIFNRYVLSVYKCFIFL